MTLRELGKSYTPAGIEEHWYEAWEKAGNFHVEANDPRKPFTIVIPPPNVTGSLHMGHALDNTLQDILTRYKRMDGFATLWLPGTDHAGIATQNVVERELLKEGLSRDQLGREKFVERVWKWKKESGGKIVFQLRRLGASCDWKRERFTMDEGLSRAVRKVFVTLYNEKLIYRGSYLVSWCPRCRTALSDLEVEYQEIDGQLTYFQYEMTDGEKITVATTRPETMLGDTAVAVHPEDSRYKKLIGKTIQHPFVPRTFPIVADEMVDPKFGTGAVKVTPAHDPNDYELGKRKGLPFVTVIDEEGKMSSEAGAYQGLDRFEARKKVVQDLKAKGLFVKSEPHKHAVGHCQRCKTVVEPRISEQWFVKIAALAKPAAEAVRNGKTTFVPENWKKVYLDWMANIRDWCISRQLWWGHQIPVWYCADCNEKTVTMEDPTKCGSCSSKKIRQDPDVLDTWFSSALWPFSTLGWPEKTPDLKMFYPTSVLVTGFDIIFFWVARMMMMGMKFMQEVPFRSVHIHALVRDEKGQKMSKSKGNVADPLELMDRYGTDAFRFALTAFAIQGRDIPLSEKRIEGYRNFITKLWNASRFSLNALGEQKVEPLSAPQTLADQWIRTRLNEVIHTVRSSLDEMKFNEAAEALYQFVWHEFCDWYIELIKTDLPSSPKTQATLAFCLDRILRLLHPMTPFVTEEIWQKIRSSKDETFLMLASYPKEDGYRSEEALSEFNVVKQVVEAIRNVRSENRINPGQKVKVQMKPLTSKSKEMAVVQKNLESIKTLSGLSELQIISKKPTEVSALGIAGEMEIYLPMEGLIDVVAERGRLQKERDKTQKDIEFLEKRLGDKKYRSKAPEHLVVKDEEKLSDARLKMQKIDQSLKSFQE